MDRSSNLSRLLHALGPGRSKPEPDWADMGTAYGLEMTLTPPGLAADAPGIKPGSAPAQAAWWQRWVAGAGR